VRRAGFGGLRAPRSAFDGIGMGEFGAEQNDLRRVVDPDEKDDEEAAAP
jgi:hypothetical protein